VDDGPKVVALSIDDGPSPVYTPQILAVLRRYGVTASFSMIGRNAAAFPGVGAIARDIVTGTRTGSIILEHDGGGNRSQTVAALTIWLPRLLEAGYQFTTP
jgi:peptidoglycan-N-acetylglucosamine deacetylase